MGAACRLRTNTLLLTLGGMLSPSADRAVVVRCFRADSGGQTCAGTAFATRDEFSDRTGNKVETFRPTRRITRGQTGVAWNSRGMRRYVPRVAMRKRGVPGDGK